jgi:imidazolonepropionase-like amidohydrolase
MSHARSVIGSLALAAAILTTSPAATQTRPLAIAGVAVVDVGSGQLLPNRLVTIERGSITSVAADAPPPDGAQVVDGRGRYLIPGLWDMHAHMEMSGAAWLSLYVANGVTAIRDMGSALDFILGVREATASGRTLGPRVFAAGPILDDAPGDWPFRMRVKTAADGKAAVQLLKGRGVDLIKVHDHTPRDAYLAIAAEAQRLTLPLAGHIPFGLTLDEIVDAGQRDVEHLSNADLWSACSGGREYRPDTCRPTFEMLAQRGVWQTPTLGALADLMTIGTANSLASADHLAYAGKGLRAMWAGNQTLVRITPELIRSMRARAQTAARVTADMAKAGVGILAGCDGTIAGFCVHEELEAMVAGGMPPPAALQTATRNPARYFGLDQSAGAVAAGRRADLVLLDGNPLSDIGNVRRIRAVVLAGRLLDRNALDNLLAEVRIAASRQ